MGADGGASHMHDERGQRTSPDDTRETLTKELLLAQARSGGRLSVGVGVGFLAVAAAVLLIGGVGLDDLEGLLMLGLSAIVLAGFAFMFIRDGMGESRDVEAQLAKGRFWLVEDVAMRKWYDADPDDEDSPTTYFNVCGKATGEQAVQSQRLYENLSPGERFYALQVADPSEASGRRTLGVFPQSVYTLAPDLEGHVERPCADFTEGQLRDDVRRARQRDYKAAVAENDDVIRKDTAFLRVFAAIGAALAALGMFLYICKKVGGGPDPNNAAGAGEVCVLVGALLALGNAIALKLYAAHAQKVADRIRHSRPW